MKNCIISAAIMMLSVPAHAQALPQHEATTTSVRQQSCLMQLLFEAAAVTGVDFKYLVETARRESGFNPTAKASSSTAAGLFQFTEDTWLRSIDQFGPNRGFATEAASITVIDGAVNVSAVSRTEILKMRFDPATAAIMAGDLTRQTSRIMEKGIGRVPLSGELYLGHLMGAKKAVALIELARSRDVNPASLHFPHEAKANPRIFGTNFNPVTPGQLYNAIVGAPIDTVDDARRSSTPKPKGEPNALKHFATIECGTTAAAIN